MAKGNELGLGKKLILAAAGIAALVGFGGCGSPQANGEMPYWERNRILRENEEIRRNQANGNMPYWEYNRQIRLAKERAGQQEQAQQSQAQSYNGAQDWDKVQKGVLENGTKAGVDALGRAGGNILTNEYLKNQNK